MSLELSQTMILNLMLLPVHWQLVRPYSLMVLSVTTVEYFILPSLYTYSCGPFLTAFLIRIVIAAATPLLSTALSYIVGS